MFGCYPGWIVPGKVDVFIKKPVYHYNHVDHLVIVPFESSEPSSELGYKAARIFEEEINKKYFFNKITLITDSIWSNQIDHRDQKIRKALFKAKQEKADLMLLGSIEDFKPGTATETKVTLNVNLINVSNGETLWWGKDSVVGKPGNTFLLWGTLLSPNPPDVNRLLYHATQKIVSDMFSESTVIEKPGFFKKLVEQFYSKKPVPPIKSHKEIEAEKPNQEPELDEKVQIELSIPETKDSQEAQVEEPIAEPPAFEDKTTSKDILDKALDKLESFETE
jgi:hypothetical protein